MPDADLEENILESVVKFISDVKNGKIEGSYNITTATVAILKTLVSEVKFDNAEQLLDRVRTAGRVICRGLPQEAVTGNMVRRILRIIREEYHAAGKNTAGGTGDSLQGLLRGNGEEGAPYRQDVPALRAAVLDHISEFQSELETCGDNIRWQAPEHIHTNEMILTLGWSRLVEMFLKRAAVDGKFHVIVAEGAPGLQGHKMATRLAKANMETTLIADSSIFAVMSRVNKVMLGTQTVLAGGGLRAAVGAHTVALAAKHYSVPVIILCPLYKLCPEHLCNYEQENFNTLASPEGALPYSIGSLAHRSHAYHPLYDYVPPDLVTLFITNLGGNAPSYIYRLLSELYHPDDYNL